MKNQFTSEQYNEIEAALGECALNYLIDNLASDFSQPFDELGDCIIDDSRRVTDYRMVVMPSFADKVNEVIRDFEEHVAKIDDPTRLAELFFAARVAIDSGIYCSDTVELLVDVICRHADEKFGSIVDTFGQELVCYTECRDAIIACEDALKGAGEINDVTIRLAFDFAMRYVTDNVSVEGFINKLLDERNWSAFHDGTGVWEGLPKNYIGEAYRKFVFDELRACARNKREKRNHFAGRCTMIDPVIELSSSDVWDKVIDYLPLFGDWTTGDIDPHTQMQGYPPIVYSTRFKCLDWDEVWKLHLEHGQYGLVHKDALESDSDEEE